MHGVIPARTSLTLSLVATRTRRQAQTIPIQPLALEVREEALAQRADFSGARGLRRRGFGGRKIQAIEEGGRYRSPSENGAELLLVRNRTVVAPEPNDGLDLRFADTG